MPRVGAGSLPKDLVTGQRQDSERTRERISPLLRARDENGDSATTSGGRTPPFRDRLLRCQARQRGAPKSHILPPVLRQILATLKGPPTALSWKRIGLQGAPKEMPSMKAPVARP